MIGVGDRLADLDLGDAGERHDLSGGGLLDVGPLQPLERLETGHLVGLDRAVQLEEGDRAADPDRAAGDPADRHPPDVVVVVEIRDLELQRRPGVARRARDRREDGVEQGTDVLVGPFQLAPGVPQLARSVQVREVELLVGGPEVEHQLEHLVQHRVRAGVRPVHLVDHDDRTQAELQRLLEHEAGLRQRPLRRVDQEQDAVHHPEDPLDLASEVGVPRRVDDVDLDALVADRGVLRQDGDAALALQIVAVHDPLHEPLVRAEGAGLLQQPIHERRLAMVDVRDDRDVPDVAPADGMALHAASSDQRIDRASVAAAASDADCKRVDDPGVHCRDRNYSGIATRS